MKSQRVEYLDAIKGSSILLVVFCHYVLLSKETVVGNMIMCMAWGAVPCFMMVSGALMHHSTTFSWHKYFNKLFKLYAVLVVWRGIYLVVACILGAETGGKAEVFQYLFLCQEVSYVNTGVMWYMVAFLVVLLLYPATWYLFRQGGRQGKQLVCFLAVIAFIGAIFTNAADFLMEVLGKILGISALEFTSASKFFPFSNYGNMLFYFLLGAFLYEKQETLLRLLRRCKWIPLTGIFAGTLGLMVIKFVQCGTLAWNNTYLLSGYSRLSTVFLAVGMFTCAMLIGEHRVTHVLAEYVGRYTMGIYYIHYLLLSVCSQFIFPHIVQRSVAANVLKTTLVTLVCVLVTAGVRKIPCVRTLVQ